MGSYICRICHRPLKRPISVQLGIGPECLKKWGAKEYDGDLAVDEILLPFEGDLIFELTEGKRATNVPRQIVKHSPTGYAWGYGGSGPADLALNALLLYTTAENAFQYYQRFKHEFIASLPEEGGKIEGTVVKKWIDKRIKEASFEYTDFEVVT